MAIEDLPILSNETLRKIVAKMQTEEKTEKAINEIKENIRAYDSEIAYYIDRVALKSMDMEQVSRAGYFIYANIKSQFDSQIMEKEFSGKEIKGPREIPILNKDDIDKAEEKIKQYGRFIEKELRRNNIGLFYYIEVLTKNSDDREATKRVAYTVVEALATKLEAYKKNSK